MDTNGKQQLPISTQIASSAVANSEVVDSGVVDSAVMDPVGASYDWDYIINGAIIPAISVCGIIGNFLNLVILSWRYKKKGVDVLEKGSLLGLISLTVSDMMFCIVILPHMFYYKQKTAFNQYSFRMFYHVYGIYFQNVFIKTSTFLTLVVGVARYLGICHPLRARVFISLKGMRVTCTLTYVLWFSLMSPMLWMYKIEEFPISNTTIMYVTDLGTFGTNKSLNTTCTYTWALVGYFIPVAVLAFCNVNLIRALRQSMRLRRTSARGSGSSTAVHHEVSLRITLTLILLIVMFMVLVSPSEILHFVLEVFDKNQYQYFEVIMMFSNVLQAVNFAFHFVLYCIVNTTFRKSMVNLVLLVVKKCRPLRAGGRVVIEDYYRPDVISVKTHQTMSNRLHRQETYV